MKNKAFILTLLLAGNLPSQTTDWAPVGAKWYYDLDVAGGNSYIVYKVEKDTLFQGVWCKKIVMDATSMPSDGMQSIISYNFLGYNGYAPNSPIPSSMTLTFRRNDTVFFYHHSCGSFVPVANLNSDTGHVWNIMGIRYDENFPVCPPYISFKITQVDTMYWGSYQLKQFIAQPLCCNPPIHLPRKFTEGIGWDGAGLLPVWYSNIIDGIYLGNLRCYYHPNLGWKHFVAYPCDTVSGIKTHNNIEDKSTIFYYNHQLFFNLSKDMYPISVKIINCTGQCIYEATNYNEPALLMDKIIKNNQILFVLVITKNGSYLWKKIYYED